MNEVAKKEVPESEEAEELAGTIEEDTEAKLEETLEQETAPETVEAEVAPAPVEEEEAKPPEKKKKEEEEEIV